MDRTVCVCVHVIMCECVFRHFAQDLRERHLQKASGEENRITKVTLPPEMYSQRSGGECNVLKLSSHGRVCV